MKKIILAGFAAALFASCGSSSPEGVKSEKLPQLEESWAQAIEASYPEWERPSYTAPSEVKQ
ncbi:MAG: hypothetical protein RL095_3562 [Verrucomicrobiota bacterium]|jgi:hypothetical protein